jgi:hypothetical protein
LIFTGEIFDINNRAWLTYRLMALGMSFVKGLRSAHAEHVACVEAAALDVDGAHC